MVSEMNKKQYSLKEWILTAIKSEIDSKAVYTTFEKKVKNGLMKDKFHFLATEEMKHQKYLETVFKKTFPKDKLLVPKKTPVPLPEINISKDEDTPLSLLLSQAMIAEKAAQEFYRNFSKQFNDRTISHMLEYFADMELGHYRILQTEKESMERFEEADIYWPMIHAGP